MIAYAYAPSPYTGCLTTAAQAEELRDQLHRKAQHSAELTGPDGPDIRALYLAAAELLTPDRWRSVAARPCVAADITALAESSFPAQLSLFD